MNETPGEDEIDVPKEPTNEHIYQWITLYRDTFLFYLKALEFYASIIDRDVEALEGDAELKKLVPEEQRRSLKIYNERDRAHRMVEWAQKKVEERPDSFGYVNHLKLRRNKLSAKPNISRHALQTIDEQISNREECLSVGIFRNATPLVMLAEEVTSETETGRSVMEAESIAKAERPRPVLLDSIQILDNELRKRCLDLFDKLREDGKHERLDTVVAEATRILENRLRSLCGAEPECVGVDLAKFAFGSENAPLVVSDIVAEQQAAHLLYRGVFGFIRNQMHHRLVGTLTPDRTLQILGMIDYLIHLAEGASKRKSK
jgi:hypothetical protein